MRAFLICPVRGKTIEDYAAYVEQIESLGFKLHYPHRDTNQQDQTGTGYRICQDNRAAIEAADVVFIVWDGESQGCLFDLGVAFALRKRIVPLSLPEPTGKKSFQNMINYMNEQQVEHDDDVLFEKLQNADEEPDLKDLYLAFGEY